MATLTQPNLTQPNLTITDPGSLGGQPGSYFIPQPTLVRWVVSQAPIVYPNRLWFVGWSARFLLYTPTDSGSLGGQLRIPNKFAVI